MGKTPNLRNLPTLEEVKAEQCRRSLARFVKEGWHVNEPTTPLIWNWHIDAICLHLQTIFEDWKKAKENPNYKAPIQNIVINIPPGTMKSRVVNVLFPAWVWLHVPSFRFICLSAVEGNVLRDAVFSRQVVESDWYQSWFKPDWKISPGENAKSYFANTATGSRISQSYSSAITGKRADAILTDDPHDAQKVESEEMRKGDTERWDIAIENRVNDPKTSFRVLMMQRLHVADLSGHLLPRGWAHLRLPMEYEVYNPESSCKCRDCQEQQTPIGFRDPRTEPGQLLFPDRFPQNVLDSERNRLGAYGYAGQMQQRPIPEGGSFFQKSWFKLKHLSEIPTFVSVYRYWDLAAAKPGKGDWTVGVLMGKTATGEYWILHVNRFQKEPDERDDEIIAQAALDRARYSGIKICIEQVLGLGRQAVDNLVKKLGGYAVETDQVGKDKVTRAEPFKSMARAGHVYMVEDATWNQPFLDVVEAFPGADHDDDVDGASGAFNRLALVIVAPDPKKPMAMPVFGSFKTH